MILFLTLLLAKIQVDSTNLWGSHFLCSDTHFQPTIEKVTERVLLALLYIIIISCGISSD